MTAPCQVCGIPLSVSSREACPSPSCPCYGLRAGSEEMTRAALRWRSRPSVAVSRTLAGEVAYDQLERAAWLAMQEARGELIDIEISHRWRDR